MCRAAAGLHFFFAQGGHGLAGAALGHHVACAVFAAATLRGYAKFKLNLVKAHASTGVAGNLAVRDAAANTNDHGGGPVWLAVKTMLRL